MGSIRIRQGGSFVPASAVKIRQGGQWVDASRLMLRQGGQWVQVWTREPPLTINNAEDLHGVRGVRPAITLSGGSGSYSYVWSRVSGEPYDVSNPNALNPEFSVPDTKYGFFAATYRLTVTSGSQTKTADILIQIDNEEPLNPDFQFQ
ncbi:MAG: hypothetical protein Q4B94_00235 [Pseudomonadota bacterium]|nr:hypothetical protein [Pseudomonadota bacterium]